MKKDLLLTIENPPVFLIDLIEVIDNHKRVASLLGAVLATIKLNVDKGNLVAVNDDVSRMLDDQIDRWYEEYLKSKSPREIDNLIEKYSWKEND